MLAQLPFTGLDWLPVLLAVSAAYIVFGIAGFGTALIAAPVLIHFMPLSKVVPLLVLPSIFMPTSSSFTSSATAP